MPVLLPQSPPDFEFLGYNRVDIDILGNAEVHSGGVLERFGAAGAVPRAGMGFLVRLGVGQHFLKVKEFPVERNALFRPGLQYNLQRLARDLFPFVEVHVPSNELVVRDAGARAEFHPPSGQMVQQRHLLRQPYRMVEGQLIDHHPESNGTGASR